MLCPWSITRAPRKRALRARPPVVAATRCRACFVLCHALVSFCRLKRGAPAPALAQRTSIWPKPNATSAAAGSTSMVFADRPAAIAEHDEEV